MPVPISVPNHALGASPASLQTGRKTRCVITCVINRGTKSGSEIGRLPGLTSAPGCRDAADTGRPKAGKKEADMNDPNLFPEPEPEPGFSLSAPAAVLELHGVATITDPNLPVLDAAAEPVTGPAAEAAPAKAPAKGRPGWLVPVAIGAIGLIAAGTLGGLLYVNTGQRDLARQQLAATTATLATTKASLADSQQQLTTAQNTLAAQAIVDKYVAMNSRDNGLVQLDVGALQFYCTDPNWNEALCRMAMQNDQIDLQKFQADRSAAQVPSQFADADSQLKDALSAGIAAIQTLIAGWDGNNTDQTKDGYSKVHAAFLAIAKAEVALGTALK
jgi:hypothetical protein